MIFGQLVSAAKLFGQFHAGTKKILWDFWLPLLKHSIKFGQVNSADPEDLADLRKYPRNPRSVERILIK